MSLHFSANQYNKAFDPKLLQNWEVPSQYRERPRAFEGFTQIVANNRGHLLSGVKRSRESPWGTFVGTWDLPLKIPGNHMLNTCARTDDAVLRLERSKTDGEIILKGKLKKCNVPSPLPVKADVNADGATPGSKQAVLPPISQTDIPERTTPRSGAKNPEPLKPLSASPKERIATPNVMWPKPGSAAGSKPGSRLGSRQGSRAGSRAMSAGAKMMSPACRATPPVPMSPVNEDVHHTLGNPEPELQVLSPVRSPIIWPTPKV